MAVALRYVNEKGQLVECFVGVEHVTTTSALSLKGVIDTLFSRHGLSISRLRGQGYDGANNMQGEFNGLKTLILRENKCAYSIHCFAHQLQLALVAVSQKHKDIAWFFSSISQLVNVVGVSYKRRETLPEIKSKEIVEALNCGDLISGRGLNQETSLARPCETRWSSHYETLGSLLFMYTSVIGVLEVISDDGCDWKPRGEARDLIFLMEQFHFVFTLHLMKTVLSITNELSQAFLKIKEQDIVNALNLVEISKKRLQATREDGWNAFLDEVSLFCGKHGIIFPIMNDQYASRSTRISQKITNLHYYRVDLFYSVLDMQLQELSNRFNEANSELLLCMTCLSPDAYFIAFDKQKIIRLAQFYPNDISPVQCSIFLGDQLHTYIADVRSSSDFIGLKGLGSLAEKMVETRRNVVYPLVYLLIKLVLVLPVATATVERVFSAMKILKNRLRNRMGDQLLNDTMVVYVESEKFKCISNEAIMQRFQKMKTRRQEL